jgi:short-subunit dehydrogenase
MAAYNVAKAGVVALSETMRIELAGHRVGVTVVCPGFFSTGLMNRARMQKPEQRDFAERSMKLSKITADDVAAAALDAARRNQLYVVLPRRARRYWYLKRFIPNFFFNRVTRKWLKGRPKSV